MNLNKNIDISEVYKILDKCISGIKLTENEKLILYRYKDKLADSSKFTELTHLIFSTIKFKSEKDSIQFNINNRSEIKLKCGFKLVPRRSSWILKLGDVIYLDSLDNNLASRIALDINVAILIKLARLNNLNQ